MARVTLKFDGLTAEQLRVAVRALNHELYIAQEDNIAKRGQVGLDGPECWNFLTPPLAPPQAAIVCYAVNEMVPKKFETELCGVKPF